MKEKELDFEAALKKLEAIVEELEGGDLSLNDAIKKYEEGMKLSHLCTKKLHDIEKKIEVLVKDASGDVSAKTFGEKETQGSKKTGRKAEELLF
ncbi:MAG: exodeoxyribonuclease VII small subunit [Candidatus Omnitrophica bacterium]|nr:exodeoxyribonuclease VII small subunit [Candidatus Omnitrophota bacterium]